MRDHIADPALQASLSLHLLNDYQQNFPLCPAPFAGLAAKLGVAETAVLRKLEELRREGRIARVGAVFAPKRIGASTLAAMAVPPGRLQAVAAQVSAHPGVNHNYEREHHYNLWFVMTGQDDAAVRAAMQSLEDATDLPALQLRMERAYRIDLGFDLRQRTAPTATLAASSTG